MKIGVVLKPPLVTVELPMCDACGEETPLAEVWPELGDDTLRCPACREKEFERWARCYVYGTCSCGQ